MGNGLRAEAVQVETLVDLLQQRGDRQGDCLAYGFMAEGEAITDRCTYGTLAAQAQGIAAQLQARRCQGQPVLLLYPPGLDYIAAFFGCLYAGAIAVPAYPPRPNRSLERLAAIALDTQARVALTHPSVLANLQSRLGETAPLQALDWIATPGDSAAAAGDWTPPALNRDSLALLQYTSGSTGTPKGVMISHGNLLHNSARIQEFFGDTPQSRGVSWLPPYHDMGLVGGILQPLYVGAPMMLMPPVAFLQKPIRWLQAISDHQATTSGGPNFAYDLCVQKIPVPQRQALDLSRWALAFSGAEPVRAETLARFAEAFAPVGFQAQAFYPCYGMAEVTLMVTGGARPQLPITQTLDAAALQENRALPPQDSSAEVQTLVGCGHAPPQQPVAIVNPQTLAPCPEGTIGEIWVAASPSLAQGYWQQPEATATTFQARQADGSGPYLRTGDLGFLQGDTLYVTGRLKELIIIRGRNYYPQDIEATVAQAHPALRAGAGAAFAITVGSEERLVVVQEVERQALRQLDGEEITAAIRQAIAEHHDLQLYGLQLLKTATLPKTSSGKIQRYRCRAGYLDHLLEAVYHWQLSPDTLGATEPADLPPPPPWPPVVTAATVEQWLAAWLAPRIGVDPGAIDPQRPLAEYGLDSVAAVELTADLEANLERPLSPTLAYEYPTLGAIATHLSQPEPAPAPSPALPPGEPDLDALVEELGQLSEAELEALLRQ